MIDVLLVPGAESWYLSSLFDDTYGKIMQRHRENKVDTTEALMQLINETFPSKFEQIPNLKHRCDMFRHYLKLYLNSSEGGGGIGVSADQGKVAVVGHSMFFRCYTTD